MKAFGNFLGIITGLAIIVGLLVGGYYLFQYIVNVFGTLEPQLKTITAIASIVALLCASIIAGGLKSWNKKEFCSGTIMDKANIYQQLLSQWTSQLKCSSVGGEWMEDVELTNLEQQLALYGGTKVITAYVNLRKLAGQENESGDEVATLLNKLVMEMRTDLGCAGTNLKADDIHELVLGRG